MHSLGSAKIKQAHKAAHLSGHFCAFVQSAQATTAVCPRHELWAAQEPKPVLKTSLVGPNSLFTYLKERVRCDLERLKNRLQRPSC